MGYIKISDPNIIDLAAWHQVINVVNQHSDSLNSLTNNFGLANATPSFSGENTSVVYDLSSQQIVYGRAKAYYTSGGSTNTPNTIGGGGATTAASIQYFYNSVTFANSSNSIPSFTTTPFIFATLHTGDTSGAVSTSNSDAIVTIYNPTQTGFNYRIVRAAAYTIGLAATTSTNKNTANISGAIYINWVAIGPRG